MDLSNKPKKPTLMIIKKTDNPIQVIANKLFEAEMLTHMMHLEAKKKSYAEHIALGEFYTAIGDLNDNLIEKSYVEYGIMTNYNVSITTASFKASGDYLREVYSLVSKQRESVSVGFIQQIIDDILDLISGVVYKLDNLC